MDIKQHICKILNDSQYFYFDTSHGITSLKSIINSELSSLNNKEDIETEFLSELFSSLEVLLSTNEQLKSNFIVDFLVKFMISLNENDDEIKIQDQILLYVIQNSKANADIVRLRVCNILKKYLEQLQMIADGEISETVYEKLKCCLCERMRDVNLDVQKSAIQMARFVQAPKDKYCPIIEKLIYLLKHDSFEPNRLIILDFIAINNLTFDFLKNHLLYDASMLIRNKVLEIVQKKVPNKFVDVKFKHQIINSLFRNQNYELLEKFVIKWLQNASELDDIPQTDFNNNITKNDNFNFYKLIESFKLESTWFSDEANLDYKIMTNIDEKLQVTMNFAYSHIESDEHLVNNLIEKIVIMNGIESLFLDLNLAFFFRTTICYLNKRDKISLLEKRIRIENANQNSLARFDTFFEDLSSNLKTNWENAKKMIIFYNLIASVYVLDINLLNKPHYSREENETKLLSDLIDAIPFSDESHCLFDLIFSNYEAKTLDEYVFMLINAKCELEDEDLKKSLSIFSSFLSKLARKEFEAMQPFQNLNLSFENLNLTIPISTEDTDENELNVSDYKKLNIVEVLTQAFILKHISSKDPSVRSLCVRALGLCCVLSICLAESYIRLLAQIILVDYPEVVVESLKAIFNILQEHSNQTNEYNDWEQIFSIIENQFDCKNHFVRYTAYEGFAKLLVVNSRMPSRQKVLAKFIITYLEDKSDFEMVKANVDDNQVSSQSSNSDKTVPSDVKCFMHKNIKSLLGSFFDVYFNQQFNDAYTRIDNELVNIVIPTFRFAINKKNLANLNLRSLANFFYFYTSNKSFSSIAIISLILEEILSIQNYSSFNIIQKWIDILVEFNVHQVNIDNTDENKVKKSIELLIKINSQIFKITSKFKAAKLKLYKENELKDLFNTIKNLTSRANRISIASRPTKHKIAHEDDDVDACENDESKKLKMSLPISSKLSNISNKICN